MSITIANNDVTTSANSLSINGRELVEVAFSGSYNDLVDKPSGGNSQLSEVWVSDDHTQWYRKYSDGYIEQYGIISDVKDEASVSVTFPTSFATICHVAANKTRHRQGCAFVHGVKQDSGTLTGFNLQTDSWDNHGSGNVEKVYWTAHGY